MSRSPIGAAGRMSLTLVMSVLVAACGAAAAPEGSPAPSQEPLPGGSDAPGPAAHSDAPRNSSAPSAPASAQPVPSSDAAPPPAEDEPEPGPIGGPDEVGATITVDGMTWWFEVELGYPLDCVVSEDGTHIVANGRVGGHLDGIGFAADLSPAGGWLEVDDPTTGEHWMARADRAGTTVLHEVPEGSSQIDTVAVEGGRANGTATFIETRAYEDAWLKDGTFPAAVFGTFVIRCPSS